MTDRGKVINAINICLGKGHCDDCGYSIKGGYSTMDCRKPMLRDALALLKEQEARVLTLEEVLGGDECWVEYINGGCGYCDCYLDDDAKSIVINRTLRKDFNVSPNGYGKVWRCWSARPTDEQREAVKWDG